MTCFHPHLCQCPFSLADDDGDLNPVNVDLIWHAVEVVADDCCFVVAAVEIELSSTTQNNRIKKATRIP